MNGWVDGKKFLVTSLHEGRYKRRMLLSQLIESHLHTYFNQEIIREESDNEKKSINITPAFFKAQNKREFDYWIFECELFSYMDWGRSRLLDCNDLHIL